jgi:hypothetical protein
VNEGDTKRKDIGRGDIGRLLKISIMAEKHKPWLQTFIDNWVGRLIFDLAAQAFLLINMKV